MCMEVCVGNQAYRGAVIAEFNDKQPRKATFCYMNSLDNKSIVDEFQLASRIPDWNMGNNPS